jgi:hypothetical protein
LFRNEVNKNILSYHVINNNVYFRRFGLMQSKMAIVKIIQNFEISPSATMKSPIKFVPSSPFLSPLGGILLDFKTLNV